MKTKTVKTNAGVAAIHDIAGIRTEGKSPYSRKCRLVQGDAIIRYLQEVF